MHCKVPPDKKGITQVTPAQLSKTSLIAKVRLLKQQVIRRLKAFRILYDEIPISL